MKVDANTTIPENVSIVLPAGSTIEVSDGASLTVHGRIEAGPYPVFTFGGSHTGTVAAASTFKRTGRLLPQWFGVVGDGSANDTDAFQRCLAAASSAGKTVFLHAGTKIRTVDVLWLHSAASVVGESRDACEIILDADLGNHAAYWFNLGLTAKPAWTGTYQDGEPVMTPVSTVPWCGRLTRLRFKVKDGNSVVRHMVQLHSARDFELCEVTIDITGLDPATATTTLASIIPNSWASTVGVTRGRIHRTRHLARSSGGTNQGPAGINLIQTTNSEVVANIIDYVADDPLAVLHSASRNFVGYNRAYATRGRIGIEGPGADNRFLSNYLQRVRGVSQWYPAGTNFFAAVPEINASEGADVKPKRTLFAFNQCNLPGTQVDQQVHNLLELAGAETAVVLGNALRSDYEPRAAADVGLDCGTFQPGAGYQIRKPSNLAVTGNIAFGSYPAVLIERKPTSSTDSDILGPHTFVANLAGGYVLTGPRSAVGASNGLSNGSGADYTQMVGLGLGGACCVARFTAFGVRAGISVMGLGPEGGTRQYLRHQGLLGYLVANLDGPASGGVITGQLRKGSGAGSSSAILNALSIDPSSQSEPNTRSAVLDASGFSARAYGGSGSDDYFEVEVQGGSGLLGTYDVFVEVYAIHVRA
ncbi:MAG: hypothetical protein IT371_11175 [Deltaproteobacteria bacterium]|nr:hypothetical protein [Deltaproteobacteria bacterium]